jgi:sugar phosphate isomerase/epimerase
MTYYDVGNPTRNGFNIVDEIRRLGRERICEVHLKDNPHCFGHGSIDFATVDAAGTGNHRVFVWNLIARRAATT